MGSSYHNRTLFIQVTTQIILKMEIVLNMIYIRNSTNMIIYETLYNLIYKGNSIEPGSWTRQKIKDGTGLNSKANLQNTVDTPSTGTQEHSMVSQFISVCNLTHIGNSVVLWLMQQRLDRTWSIQEVVWYWCLYSMWYHTFHTSYIGNGDVCVVYII